MSYDDTRPADLDKARHILGDVSNNSATELLTDDHIESLLSAYSYNIAVSLMAQGLAARSAQDYTSITLPSGLAVAGKKATDYWQWLAEKMRSGGVTSSGAFSVASPRADGYATAASDEFARP